jgi:hypothetical protein
MTARAPGPAGLLVPGPEGGPPPAVTVHLLGELQVVLGERPVGRWVSRRGRAVFEYLVAHQHARVRRDRLMTVFWPDVAPEAARNSLNVAIHRLRRSLRAAGDHPVVRHQDGSYFLDPALDLSVSMPGSPPPAATWTAVARPRRRPTSRRDRAVPRRVPHR